MAESFPMLVHGLCVQRYRGNVRAMARAVGVPLSTLDRWIRGDTEDYRTARVIELCERCKLDVGAVLSLIAEDTRRRALGIRPAAFTAARRRGPAPSPDSVRSRRRRRGAAVLLVALTSLAATSSAAAGSALQDRDCQNYNLRLIGSWRRRRWDAVAA